MRVSIERMRLSDLDDVMRIERQCYPTPWQEDTFRYEIVGNPQAYYVVAHLHRTQGTTAVGYAGMWLVAGEAHITTVAVDPLYRGLKIGERLLVDLLDAAMRRGAFSATLEVREGNLVAQRLYIKYCFDAVGMRRGYYSDTGENAILMWIEDLADPHFLRVFHENRRKLEGHQHAAAGR